MSYVVPRIICISIKCYSFCALILQAVKNQKGKTSSAGRKKTSCICTHQMWFSMPWKAAPACYVLDKGTLGYKKNDGQKSWTDAENGIVSFLSIVIA